MNCSLQEAVKLLKLRDNILIVTHKHPDGDAIGSSFALYFALLKMGKNVVADIGNRLPNIYSFVYGSDYSNKYDFKPEFIVSVDLADTKLLLRHLKSCENKIDLAIDHHEYNILYAKNTLLYKNAASTTELLYNVIIELLGEENIDAKIASCLYLGLATDTGCFQYSSVTAKTHYIAANLLKQGADFVNINKKMFNTKSKKKLQIEQIVISNIEYYFNEQCAFMFISKLLQNKFDVSYEELEGFSGLPIQIEGVEIGITMKEKEDEYKVSVRTSEKYNASEICKMFGGGGHKRAAGCTLKGEYNIVKEQLLLSLSKFIKSE